MLTHQPSRSEVTEGQALERAVAHLRAARVALPTFGQLANPELIPAAVRASLARIGPDEAEPLNLFRVHWHNGSDRASLVDVPEHLVLPRELTGVQARIVVALGDRFPLIRAHKVLAAYGCLAPRLVTGEFDPTRHRAIWPSTGNYCRGGVAISRRSTKGTESVRGLTQTEVVAAIDDSLAALNRGDFNASGRIGLGGGAVMEDPAGFGTARGRRAIVELNRSYHNLGARYYRESAGTREPCGLPSLVSSVSRRLERDRPGPVHGRLEDRPPVHGQHRWSGTGSSSLHPGQTASLRG